MKVLYTVEDMATGKHADIEWGNFGTYIGPTWDGNAKGPFPPWRKAWPRNRNRSLAFIVGHYYTVGKKGMQQAGIGRIVKLIGERQPLALWALCANPSRYRIRDAVEHLEVDYWTIGRADVNNGDNLAIWQTRDSDGHRGVVALGRVVGEPTIRQDLENPYWARVDDGRAEVLRVPVRYQRLSVPLWVDDTKTGQFLASLSVARAKGGTVFRLTDEQWAHLVDLAGGFMSEDPIVEEIAAAARGLGGRATGQGFGLSADQRAAVEGHAMVLAKKYFKASWPSVVDVSGKCSFDLLCRSATSELRVEVKGTTSSGEQIVLTKREVDEANIPEYALFVVSDIVLATTGKSVFASGGQCRVISQWRQNKHSLNVIAYSVTLDWSEGEIVEPEPTPTPTAWGQSRAGDKTDGSESRTKRVDKMKPRRLSDALDSTRTI